MEADVNFKQFAYRSSLSVMSKSSLNLVNMVNSVIGYSPSEDLLNFDVTSQMTSPAPRERVESQMQKIQRKNTIRVAIINDKAYFVHNNTFYVASMIDGEVDKSSASPINAFDISKREMNQLLSILDNMNT